MLQSIRSTVNSRYGSYIVKLLFAVLIVAFGSWGVGDFLRTKPTDETVAVVDGHKILPVELQKAMQSEVSRLREQGQPTSPDQLRAQGVVDRVMKELVDRALFDRLAADEHLVAGDAQIQMTIESEPAFRNKDNKFDPAQARAALARANLTQQQMEAMIAEDLPRQAAASPSGAVSAPDAMVQLLVKIRGETRVADYVSFPVTSAAGVAPPTEDEARKYYTDHPDRFTAPEFRAFTLLSVGPEDVAAPAAPTEDQLHDAYQQRQDELSVPEERHVLQIVAPDEKTAEAASAELAAGKDFTETAKKIAHQDPSTIDLGSVKKSDLPAETADAIFKAAAGETGKPVKTPFGWNIFKISEIKPARTVGFDEAKPILTQGLEADARNEALYKLTNRIEDELAAGVELNAIVDQDKLKLTAIPAADAQGKKADGSALPDLKLPVDTLMTTVFQTAKGQASTLQEASGANRFFLVRVDGITPPTVRPFETVKDAATKGLLDERKAAAVADRAKVLAASVKPEQSLAALAQQQKLDVKTSPKIVRKAGGPAVGLPAEAVQILFKLKAGEARSYGDADGAWAFQLKDIAPPSDAEAKDTADRIRAASNQTLGNEALEQFAAALKQRYPVELHPAVIDRLYPATPQ